MNILNELKRHPLVVRAEQAQVPEGYEGAVSLVTFRYRSGAEEIEGMAAAPVQLQQGQSLPAIVFCHGGNRDLSPMRPETACRLAAAGYIGLGSQYRGCAGSTGTDGFGGEDVDDVIRLMDLAEKLSFVRPGGMYLLGHSRGGMMAYLCAARDSRVRAVAIGAGMADCFMMYRLREQAMKDVFHELVGGPPEQFHEEFVRRSAVCWPEKIQAPVLVCQGTNDWRVDPQQSYNMVKGLRAAGKECRLCVYENADHSLRGTKYYDDVFAWFAEHPLEEKEESCMQNISQELLSRCRAQYQTPGAAAAGAIRAVTKVGPLMAGMEPQAVRALPFSFSVDLAEDGVTDQGTSLRCWTFASLNPVRQHIARTLNLQERNFELSQNYTYFYDQLEKSGRFLSEMIARIEQPLDSPELVRMLRQPLADSGQWYIFADLAKKYGVVPKFVMPDTQCSPDTRYVTRTLGDKLRLGVKQLRDEYAQSRSTERLEALREQVLEGVFGILCRFLGVPPTKFTFEYRDRAGQWHCIADITPQDFFRTYGGCNPDDYMMIIHHPSEKRPFMQTYYMQDYTGKAPEHGSPAILLNAPLPLIKQAVIAQLKAGEQVVMGCDVAKQSSKPMGYMDAHLYAFEELFGTDLEMSKADRILYKGTCGTHLMSFSGVNLRADGTPDRWKVQNSYGQGMGIDGHYVMADSWFDVYVLCVVSRMSLAPESLKKAF